MRLPDICDMDIEAAEAQWGFPLDQERRAVLRCMDTVDIRACPGSGKTTLLVTKLGILASKWNYKHRGICVLSHTNAARREIEKRFSQVPSLRALTAYPHFVGTIQSFLHSFLATPGAVEKFGTRPSIVDNDRYEVEAMKEFVQGQKQGGPYDTARKAIPIWIRRNPEYASTGDYVGRYIEFVDKNLSLPPLGTKKQPVRWDSTTGKQLQQFKERMSQQGMFRYQDMAALAGWYLEKHPMIADLLQERFPIVFFDEMQDTIVEQWCLLDALFPERSVVQRFGDNRQAIYHSTADNMTGAHFPRGTVLPMKKSFRLSPSIARLSQYVCADSPPEELIGDTRKADRRHTVLVFKRDRIQEVLPNFCRLVAREICTGLSETQVKAVGANSKAKEEANKFPSAISDYWPSFVPRHQRAKARLTCLSAHLDQAQTGMITNRSTGEGRTLLLEACARMLRLQGVTDISRSLSPSTMVRQLREKCPVGYLRLNTLLAITCQTLLRGGKPNLDEFAEEARAALGHFNAESWNPDVDQFIRNTSGEANVQQALQNQSLANDNVFCYQCEAGPVSVKVDTIHSVKGETLCAVLVLETIFYEHDLMVLIDKGYLKGQLPNANPRKRLAEHLKRIYVAMTRPTNLLCLAVLDEHIKDGDLQALDKLGWAIKEVR